ATPEKNRENRRAYRFRTQPPIPDHPARTNNLCAALPIGTSIQCEDSLPSFRVADPVGASTIRVCAARDKRKGIRTVRARYACDLPYDLNNLFRCTSTVWSSTKASAWAQRTWPSRSDSNAQSFPASDPDQFQFARSKNRHWCANRRSNNCESEAARENHRRPQ